jgi:hypothetical protein
MAAVPAVAAVGSARLGSMRFMLRGRTEGGAAPPGAAGAASGQALPPSLPPSARAGAPGAPARLLCARDSSSTATGCLDAALTDQGGMVSGRRSFGGGNRVVEAAARSAYASERGAQEEVTDAALAKAGFAGEATRVRAEQLEAKAGGAAAAGGGGAKRRHGGGDEAAAGGRGFGGGRGGGGSGLSFISGSAGGEGADRGSKKRRW